MELLLSFRNSGFSVDTSPTVWPQDTQGLERLCRYLLRCPVSLSRIHWTPGSRTLFYESKGSLDDPLLPHSKGESFDILEFIARVLTQIFAEGRSSKRPRNISYPRRSPKADDSEPRKHGVHYLGVYASRSRVFRKKRAITLHSLGDNDHSKSKAEPELSPKKRAALRKSWAQLIKRVYQVDPLKCQCGGTLRVIGFITEHKVIRKILDHLDKRNGNSRAPPKH